MGERERQRHILEDELGRPLHALVDDDLARSDETFRRRTFEAFASARRVLSGCSLREYLEAYAEDRKPPLMVADALDVGVFDQTPRPAP